MTYLLAIAAVRLLRAVAIAAAIDRATVVRLRLVAQAIAGIATSELGPGIILSIINTGIEIGYSIILKEITVWQKRQNGTY